MATRKAGEVHSFRLPAGEAKEFYELTGMKVSTFCRQQVQAMIELKKREAGHEQRPAS